MLNRFALVATTAFGIVLSASAWAQSGGEHLSATDQAFINQAAAGSAAEVATGRLASQKGSSEEVKMFGRWMASSHGFAGRELTSIVERLHGTTPSTELPSDAQQLQAKLQGLSGKAFDQAYLEGMIEDHKKDLQQFQQGAQNTQDLLVKSFAQNMVPVIREHLQQVQDLDQDLFHASAHGHGQAANAVVQGRQTSAHP